MLNVLRFTTACLAGALSPWLLAVTVIPSAADEQLKLKNIISMPDGQKVGAFDISYVDPASHTLAVAMTATAAPFTGPGSNPAIVIVDTQFNVVVNTFNPGFTGSVLRHHSTITPARTA